MINRGSHQFTCGWIIICCIWLSFNLMTTIQANKDQYQKFCHVKIQDEHKAYKEFKDLQMSDSVKLIFFQLQIGNDSLILYDSTFQLAWIKSNLGKAIFTLPTSFIEMSLSLYTIFIGSLNITLLDSKHNCFKNSDIKDRTNILMQTLMNFTQFGSNETCNNKYCSTICERHFLGNDGNFPHKIMITCCQKDHHNPQTDVGYCLFNNEQPHFYVPLSKFFIIILSLCLAGIVMNKIFNWFLDSAQR